MSKTDAVIREMLEPGNGFDSKLEWLANWLDGMDHLIETVTNEPLGGDVQRDLRRWAEILKSEHRLTI